MPPREIAYYKPGLLSLSLIAIALTSGSLWLAHRSIPTPVNLTPKQPDSWMEEVTATFMNKEGLPAARIVTPRVIHYAITDKTEFLKPAITLYRNSPEPWVITSHYAETTQGIEKIFLWDNVMIHHNHDRSQSTLQFNTDSLTVFPNQEVAETNDPVTLIQPDLLVHAKGMQANLKQGTIKLLSQVQGSYRPLS